MMLLGYIFPGISVNHDIYNHLSAWKDFWVCRDSSQDFTQNNSKREHVHLSLHKAMHDFKR